MPARAYDGLRSLTVHGVFPPGLGVCARVVGDSDKIRALDGGGRVRFSRLVHRLPVSGGWLQRRRSIDRR